NLAEIDEEIVPGGRSHKLRLGQFKSGQVDTHDRSGRIRDGRRETGCRANRCYRARGRWSDAVAPAHACELNAEQDEHQAADQRAHDVPPVRTSAEYPERCASQSKTDKDPRTQLAK